MRFGLILRSASLHIKETTGIHGIAVHPFPRPALIETYNRILHSIKRIPSESVYRQSVEAITKQRLAVVESLDNYEDIEKKLNAGQIEELIMQAEDELKLISKMEEYKSWEPLEVKPIEGQWDYFGQKR
ncbi:hypothetical protein HK096_001657 [Nowakowskiella sp. JEL0078]|nr:hypothetical protein HK096_001657 [Nowakowskiella sp. JEL0078]